MGRNRYSNERGYRVPRSIRDKKELLLLTCNSKYETDKKKLFSIRFDAHSIYYPSNDAESCAQLKKEILHEIYKLSILIPQIKSEQKKFKQCAFIIGLKDIQEEPDQMTYLIETIEKRVMLDIMEENIICLFHGLRNAFKIINPMKWNGTASIVAIYINETRWIFLHLDLSNICMVDVKCL